VALAAILSAAIALQEKFSIENQLSAINDVFAGASLLLAVLAGLIALQAHAAGTGMPLIEVQLWLGDDLTSRLVMVSEKRSDGTLRSVAVAGQNTLHLRLRNVSGHDADNLTVLLQFHGMACDKIFGADVNGWRIVDSAPGQGAVAAEFVSGVRLHRSTGRRLPALELGTSVQTEKHTPTAIDVHIVCDRYSRQVTVPVTFAPRQSVLATSPTALQWL
jgi:hypothetical protein